MTSLASGLSHDDLGPVDIGTTPEQTHPSTRDSDNDNRPITQNRSDDLLTLREDPLGDIGNSDARPESFKRELKVEPRLNLASLLPRTPASSSRGGSQPPHQLATGPGQRQKHASHAALGIDLSRGHALSDGHLNEPKDGGSLDWHVEGPGRRVGYDDLSAIDWIFEYTKERHRLRMLSSNTTALLGYARQMLDASHVWIVLVLTGIVVGILAAAINIASDWLGDIKFGFCKKGDGGGQFYLNKTFCCWGHDEFAQCQDWRAWRDALHIPSKGGGYVIEYLVFILFSTVFAIGASVLVKHYAIYAKHSGIPEIKTVLGGLVMRRFMGAWTLVIKSLGLCLAVASGLWLGKEGPLVHVACCCANLIMKPFDHLSSNEARKREVLSAAAAAGISVAFGAPIGGVLFSLEQLSYYFPDKTMWQSFVCAMIAAVTLQALNPFHTGKIVLYQVTYTTGWHGFELVPFVILGIIGGLYGGLFIKLNMSVARFQNSEHNPLKGWPVLSVVVVAVITAVINFPNSFMRAQLSELVYYLFAECAAIGNNDMFGLCKVTTAGSISIVTLLLPAAVMGFFLAAITFGLPIPAGIILPSLAIGALYGRALGIVVELFQQHHPASLVFAACEPDVPCITPGTYAIVGAASALAGVTRMTASIVVIMFELTGALTYVLPIMVAVMLSKWTGDAFSTRGIYESWIRFHEYPYLDNKDDTPVPDVPVDNVMTRIEDMVYIDTKKEHTIETLRGLLATTSYRGFPVVTVTVIPTSQSSLRDATFSGPASNILLGYLSRTELSYALELALSPSDDPRTPGGRNHSLTTSCYFDHNSPTPPSTSLDLRPWMDQTPITLNASSSLQLAINMFQKLGLRYLLLVDQGAFRGMLTKKDVWWVLNASETMRAGEGFVAGAGILREAVDDGEMHGDGEGRGLLRESGGAGE